MNKDINAIGIVRQMVADGQVSQEVAEKYFPELKESEDEDERIRKELIEFVKSRGGFKQEYIAWLEKQGEQKPAWSEEDEEMRYKATAVLNKLCASNEEFVFAHSTLVKVFYWLKSIKDRYTWRPSDEQMIALKCAITTADEKWVCMNTKDLESLYEDLKKLKE